MKIKNPLISVVMPVYNAEKYVAEAIESVLNQTYKNFEFIIVDDGSKDSTLEIIKKYAKKDKRIVIIKNKTNLRICKTLNKGISLAKGKYIARMDSDDISLPNRFEEQVTFMEKNPEVGVVGSWIKLFDGQSGNVIGTRKYPSDDLELRRIIFFYSPFAHPVVMIRKSFLNKLKKPLYNQKLVLAEDLDLWFRIGEISKFHNLKNILLKYRVYQNSSTWSKLKKMEKFANEIRWENRKNPNYFFGFKSWGYNWLHLISIYLIPTPLKMWLFTKFRDEKR